MNSDGEHPRVARLSGEGLPPPLERVTTGKPVDGDPKRWTYFQFPLDPTNEELDALLAMLRQRHEESKRLHGVSQASVPPHQPGDFADEDARLIAEAPLHPHPRRGQAVEEMPPCDACESAWKSYIGSHHGGIIWRCLNCGTVNRTR